MSGIVNRVEYKGVPFQVQTQDKGLGAPYVESLIYMSGKLIASRKTSYTEFLDRPDFQQVVQNIIDEQHRALLAEIQEGKFEHYLKPGEKSS
ncbi:MAG TPA: hypothetical protein PLX50_09105 [Candidatus Aminicenantes bacterium]|nr:hypothetical protein [Acidobacteriota bacterium]HOI45755.1 hypothetical protein [Candidatus Aminicenantes bacterium]